MSMNILRRTARGSVLLLVIVLLVVMSLLTLAVIGFSGQERGATASFRSGEELTACADAGRMFLLSRFRLFGQAPEQLAPTDHRLDLAGQPACGPGTPTAADARCVRSGHMGQLPTVSGVRLLQNPTYGRSQAARDLVNVITAAGSLGGRNYQVIVHCIDDRGAESEVEFTLRFGI